MGTKMRKGVARLAVVCACWPPRGGRPRRPTPRCPCSTSTAGASATASACRSGGRSTPPTPAPRPPQILATFYPGTTSARRGGAVRVAVHTRRGEAVLRSPRAARCAAPASGPQAPGLPRRGRPRRQRRRAAYDGSYHVDRPAVPGQSTVRRPQCIPVLGPCPTTTTAPTAAAVAAAAAAAAAAPRAAAAARRRPPPAAPTTAPPTHRATEPPPAPPPRSRSARTAAAAATGGESVAGAPVWAVPAGGGVVGVPARGRAYRGLVAALSAADGLRLVNEVDVETYLKGMGEVPASWPAAAQEAQAIAARTWVLRAMAASGEVCDYDRCQVYVGATREAAGQSAAVDATRGQRRHLRRRARRQRLQRRRRRRHGHALRGLRHARRAVPVPDDVRYDTPDPLPWSVDVALDDVARRFRYAGTVTGVRIAEAGPSGRALEVTLDGAAGDRRRRRAAVRPRPRPALDAVHPDPRLARRRARRARRRGLASRPCPTTPPPSPTPSAATGTVPRGRRRRVALGRRRRPGVHVGRRRPRTTRRPPRPRPARGRDRRRDGPPRRCRRPRPPWRSAPRFEPLDHGVEGILDQLVVEAHPPATPSPALIAEASTSTTCCWRRPRSRRRRR